MYTHDLSNWQHPHDFITMMGIVGATLIARWAWMLATDSARVLLDAEDHGEVAGRVRSAIESDADTQIADLWRVGTAGRGCIVSLVTHRPRPVDHYRALLSQVPGIVHLTVEVDQCRDQACGNRDVTSDR